MLVFRDFLNYSRFLPAFLQRWACPFFLEVLLLFTLSNMIHEGMNGGQQCCGAGAALFGRSREKRGGSGSSSTAQAQALTLCLKKRNKQNCYQ